MARFDYYAATIHDVSINDIVDCIHRELPDFEICSCSGKNGYTRGCKFTRPGYKESVAEIWYGGNPGVHVKASGVNSPLLAAILRNYFPIHAVTRADSCIDYDSAGLFDETSAKLIKFAQREGIKIDQRGDWTNGRSRTLYLGSRTSSVQLVLYEKGWQMIEQGCDQISCDWVRLEVRAYPKKDSRILLTTKTPTELFSISWVRDAVETLGFSRLDSFSISTVYQRSDSDKAMAALASQYGRILLAKINEIDNSERFVNELIQLIQINRARKQFIKSLTLS